MSELSLLELDAQFSELLPEREALGAFTHMSFHHYHPHQHHHCDPKPCEPKQTHPCPPPRDPCPPVKDPCPPPPPHHHCPPPPPPPCHDKPVWEGGKSWGPNNDGGQWSRS